MIQNVSSRPKASVDALWEPTKVREAIESIVSLALTGYLSEAKSERKVSGWIDILFPGRSLPDFSFPSDETLGQEKENTLGPGLIVGQ